MALEIVLNGDILEVVEVTHSFHATTRSYWYHDIKKWMSSSHGRKGDVPDRTTTPEAIEWIKQYYLLRVGIPWQTQTTS